MVRATQAQLLAGLDDSGLLMWLLIDVIIKICLVYGLVTQGLFRTCRRKPHLNPGVQRREACSSISYECLAESAGARGVRELPETCFRYCRSGNKYVSLLELIRPLASARA
jgi:hypothetical protein